MPHQGSVWGSNITDVRRVVGGTGKGLLLPVLRRSNYEHGTGDLLSVRAGALAVVVGNLAPQSLDGTRPVRSIMLPELLANVREHAAGVVTSARIEPLLPGGDDEPVLLRIQAIVLPLHSGDVVGSSRGNRDGEAQFFDSVFNYNTSSAARPKNLLLLCTPQGTSVATSRPNAQRFLQQLRADDGRIKTAFTLVAESAHAADATKVHQDETKDERQAAEAKGYGTSMFLGTKEMGRGFNRSLCIQVSSLAATESSQAPLAEAESSPSSSSLAATDPLPSSLAATESLLARLAEAESSPSSRTVFPNTDPAAARRLLCVARGSGVASTARTVVSTAASLLVTASSTRAAVRSITVRSSRSTADQWGDTGRPAMVLPLYTTFSSATISAKCSRTTALAPLGLYRSHVSQLFDALYSLWIVAARWRTSSSKGMAVRLG